MPCVSGVNEGFEDLSELATEIINSFAFSYSNDFLEGLNNLTKIIKRNAFGFRSFEQTREKILLIHQYKKYTTQLDKSEEISPTRQLLTKNSFHFPQ
jgi:hypothetical protein